MARVRDSIMKAAQSGFTVLIEGESGTGKELVARAIHWNSARRSGQFVNVNCAGVPRDLVESEFFGHEAGAFTGAHRRRIGKFEQARNGTLFLNEIGEMDVSVQAKLLRAIEENRIERLGGGSPIAVDVRFIAATNRNLRQAVAEGLFRQDLYFRLNVLTIRVPALRERTDDIPALARYLISRSGKEKEPAVLGMTLEAESILCQYPWPGNVRELRNVIQSAIAMGSSEFIEPKDLPRELFERSPGTRYEITMDEAVREVKRQYLIDAVVESRGDWAKAGKMLNLHLKTVPRMLDKLDLSHLKKLSFRD